MFARGKPVLLRTVVGGTVLGLGLLIAGCDGSMVQPEGLQPDDPLFSHNDGPDRQTFDLDDPVVEEVRDLGDGLGEVDVSWTDDGEWLRHSISLYASVDGGETVHEVGGAGGANASFDPDDPATGEHTIEVDLNELEAGDYAFCAEVMARQTRGGPNPENFHNVTSCDVDGVWSEGLVEVEEEEEEEEEDPEP